MDSFPAYYFFDALDGSDVLVCPTDFMVRMYGTTEDYQFAGFHIEHDQNELERIMMEMIGAGKVEIGNILERRVDSGFVQRVDLDKEDIFNFRILVHEGDKGPINGAAYDMFVEVLENLEWERGTYDGPDGDGWESAGGDEDMYGSSEYDDGY
ncbi:hypothetical protein HN864_04575 [archaeon]|nr:hypothetical protein [archaeon]